jgi:hypothetical protein
MILRVNIILLHVSLSHVAIAEKLTKLKFLIFSRQESAHIEKKNESSSETVQVFT